MRPRACSSAPSTRCWAAATWARSSASRPPRPRRQGPARRPASPRAGRARPRRSSSPRRVGAVERGLPLAPCHLGRGEPFLRGGGAALGLVGALLGLWRTRSALAALIAARPCRGFRVWAAEPARWLSCSAAIWRQTAGLAEGRSPRSPRPLPGCRRPLDRMEPPGGSHLGVRSWPLLPSDEQERGLSYQVASRNLARPAALGAQAPLESPSLRRLDAPKSEADPPSQQGMRRQSALRSGDMAGRPRGDPRAAWADPDRRLAGTHRRTAADRANRWRPAGRPHRGLDQGRRQLPGRVVSAPQWQTARARRATAHRYHHREASAGGAHAGGGLRSCVLVRPTFRPVASELGWIRSARAGTVRSCGGRWPRGARGMRWWGQDGGRPEAGLR